MKGGRWCDWDTIVASFGGGRQEHTGRPCPEGCKDGKFHSGDTALRRGRKGGCAPLGAGPRGVGVGTGPRQGAGPGLRGSGEAGLAQVREPLPPTPAPLHRVPAPTSLSAPRL